MRQAEDGLPNDIEQGNSTKAWLGIAIVMGFALVTAILLGVAAWYWFSTLLDATIAGPSHADPPRAPGANHG